MAAAKKLLEINLRHERTTKGTEVYVSDNADALLRNVYIQKTAFNGEAVPAEITVSVTAKG